MGKQKNNDDDQAYQPKDGDFSAAPVQAVSPAPSPAISSPAVVLPTVNELAVKHGHTFHRRAKDGQLYPTVPAHDSVFKRWHLVADVLNGWTKESNKGGDPTRLSDADYLAAIEAAKLGKKHSPACRRAEKAVAQ